MNRALKALCVPILLALVGTPTVHALGQTGPQDSADLAAEVAGDLAAKIKTVSFTVA